MLLHTGITIYRFWHSGVFTRALYVRKMDRLLITQVV